MFIQFHHRINVRYFVLIIQPAKMYQFFSSDSKCNTFSYATGVTSISESELKSILYYVGAEWGCLTAMSVE
jgi:hypothetical protein